MLRSLLEWLPIWKWRNLHTSSGKPIKHFSLLQCLFHLGQGRKEPVRLSKVEAHEHKETPDGTLNKVDTVAKDGARLGSLWEMPDMVKLCPVSKITPTSGVAHLIGLQFQDLDMPNLVKSGKVRNCCVWQDQIGLLLFGRGNYSPDWVIPKQLRTDCTALIHDQGHFGMDSDVTESMYSCLPYGTNNPDRTHTKGTT